MEFPCHDIHAAYPAAQVALTAGEAPRLSWDCHDGPHVLRVSGLQVDTAAAPVPEPGVALSFTLPPPEDLRQQVSNFAQQARCLLPPPSSSGGPVAGTAILVAFRVPGMHLFVFSEDATLTFSAGDGRRLRLEARGAFRDRKLPCKAAEILVHLAPEFSAQVLAFCLARP